MQRRSVLQYRPIGQSVSITHAGSPPHAPSNATQATKIAKRFTAGSPSTSARGAPIVRVGRSADAWCTWSLDRARLQSVT
jgi:hypothetical protein